MGSVCSERVARIERQRNPGPFYPCGNAVPGFRCRSTRATAPLRLHVLVYSGLMFAALMIGHHFSISVRWSAASASGVC